MTGTSPPSFQLPTNQLAKLTTHTTPMRRISRQYASWLPAALVCASLSLLRWWSGQQQASKAPLRQGKPTSTRCRRRQQQQRRQRRPPCPEQQLADVVFGSPASWDEDQVEALQAAAADTSHPGALLQLLQEYGSRMQLQDDSDGVSQFSDDDDVLSVSAAGSSLWGHGAEGALQDLTQGSGLPPEHQWARHTRPLAAAQKQVLGQQQQQFGQQPGAAIAAAAAAASVEDSHLGLRASDSADALYEEALRAAAARGASLSVEQHLGGGGWAHSYPPRLDEAVNAAAAGLSGAAPAGLSAAAAAAGLAPSAAGSLPAAGADAFDCFEPQFDDEFEPELDAWDFDPGVFNEPTWDEPGFGSDGGDDGVALDDW